MYLLRSMYPKDKEEGPTWWDWGHRRYLGSWRWRGRPLMPPAQTERCHHEPSSEPGREKKNVDMTKLQWTIYFHSHFWTITGFLFWYQCVLFMFCNLPILESSDHSATYFICSGPFHGKARNTLSFTQRFSQCTSIHFSLHGNIAIVTLWITLKVWHIPHSRLLHLHTYPHSSCEKNHKEVTAFNAPNKVSKMYVLI